MEIPKDSLKNEVYKENEIISIGGIKTKNC